MVVVSPLQRLSGSRKIFCTQSLGLERAWLHLSLRGDRLCPPVMWRVEEIQRICQRCEPWPAPEPPWRWSPSWARSPPASASGSTQSLRIYHSPASAPPRDPTAGSCYPCDPPFWPETPSITIHLSLCCLSIQLTFMILDCFFFCLLGPLPMSRNATWLPSPESKNGQSNKLAKVLEMILMKKRSELFWVLFWRKIWIPGSCMYWW